MALAHLDARDGVTGEMLLGALIDAGASVERVEAAVRTLGVGPVKLAWARVQRGGAPACVVRVRAPEETPDVPTWVRIRQVLAYAALADPVREHALEAVRRLVTAEAEAGGIPIEDLDLSPVGVLDTLAVVVGVCAAVHELALEPITTGPVGVGTGEIESLVGRASVPSPAVTRLLHGFRTVTHSIAAELTSATGAALLATLVRRGTAEPPAAVSRVGVGAGMRRDHHEPVVRLLISTATTPGLAGPSE